MPTTPQDHKTKAKPFTFTGKDGKTYKLPLIAVGKGKLSGRDLRDATLGGEQGQLAYAFKILEAAEPAEAVLTALYDLPQDEMLDVLVAWGDHGDGDGASLGKSSSSST